MTRWARRYNRPTDAPTLMGEFGRRVHRLRTARGLSQAELAHRMGSDHAQISRWEAGKGQPELATLVRLIAALGCEPNDLLGDLDVAVATLDALATTDPKEGDDDGD